jgi:hypothetical protein
VKSGRGGEASGSALPLPEVDFGSLRDHRTAAAGSTALCMYGTTCTVLLSRAKNAIVAVLA